MDLVKIKDYENYSFDKNTNQVYNTKYKRFLKPILDSIGYYVVEIRNNKSKMFKLHRLIYQVYNPNIDITNLEIDHIDNNRQNNNIENLRHCNRSENQCNKKVQKNNKLQEKNIRIIDNSYQVRITKNKIVYSKRFKTLEEAILHRDIKLIELHGKFHSLG